MIPMKINVFKKNEYTVHFEMSESSDGLPETGEHFIIPVNEAHLFVAQYLEEQAKEIKQALNVSFRLTRFDEDLKLLNQKIDSLNFKGENK